MMIWAIAIDDGAKRVRRAAAPSTRGGLLRIGGAADDDLAIPECGRIAELVNDGVAWRVKAQGEPMRSIVDGETLVLGVWRVTLVLEPSKPRARTANVRRLADVLAALDCEDDLPAIESSGRRITLSDCAPIVVGDALGCDLNAGRGGGVLGIVRWDPNAGIATLWPAQSLRRPDGSPVDGPTTLRDGDRVLAGREAELRFRNPQERLDGLLASPESERTADPQDREDSLPAVASRGLPTVGERPDDDVSPWELGLLGASLVAVLAMLAVYAARW